jgi:hypothetical protein
VKEIQAEEAEEGGALAVNVNIGTRRGTILIVKLLISPEVLQKTRAVL